MEAASYGRVDEWLLTSQYNLNAAVTVKTHKLVHNNLRLLTLLDDFTNLGARQLAADGGHLLAQLTSITQVNLKLLRSGVDVVRALPHSVTKLLVNINDYVYNEAGTSEAALSEKRAVCIDFASAIAAHTNVRRLSVRTALDRFIPGVIALMPVELLALPNIVELTLVGTPAALSTALENNSSVTRLKLRRADLYMEVLERNTTLRGFHPRSGFLTLAADSICNGNLHVRAQEITTRNRSFVWSSTSHKLLYNVALALAPLMLPPYVLLEIVEWFGEAAVRWPHVKKIRVLINTTRSYRAVLARHDERQRP